MRFAQGFRHEGTNRGRISEELDHLMAAIRGGWKVEHNPDGTHNDITGDSLDVLGRMMFGGPWEIQDSAVTTPPIIVANVNDYNPRGLDVAQWLRLETDASRTITGIQRSTGIDRFKYLYITNVGNFDLVLAHNSLLSQPRNRIGCPGSIDCTLVTSASALLWYDNQSANWRVVAGTGGAAGVGSTIGAHASSHEAGGADVVEVFPVSSIFISTSATNPATSLGYGTWSLFSQGRVLVGLAPGDPDFGTVLDELGSKTITLTPSQGGGDAVIEEQEPSGVASVTFSSIPSIYRELRVVVQGRGDNASTQVEVSYQFNGDTAANYDSQRLRGVNISEQAEAFVGQTSMQIGTIPAASATSNKPGCLESRIYNYAATTFHAICSAQSGHSTTETAAGMFTDHYWGSWRDTSAVTSLKVLLSAGDFVSGSKVTLYGVA